MAEGRARIVFNLSGVADEYADEVLEIEGSSAYSVWLEVVHNLTVDIEGTPPTGAVVEVDTLRSGGDRNTESHWNLARYTYEAAGVQPMQPFAAQYGVRLRCKSGAVAGDLPVSVNYD